MHSRPRLRSLPAVAVLACLTLLAPCLTGAMLFADDAANSRSETPPASADRPPDKNPAENTVAKLTPAAAAALVQQLKSSEYQQRNRATKKLIAAGKVAVKPVAAAAQTDDLELGSRCVNILQHLYKHGDETTTTAAEAELKQLKESKHPRIAEWAADALRKPEPQRTANNGGGIIINGNGNGIRIRIVAGAKRAGAVRIRPRFQREVNTTDKGRKIHIKETFGAGGRTITMTITEKVNGKEKVTQYKANGLAELKKKSKEAFELYQKHIRKGKVKRIGGNAKQGGRILQRKNAGIRIQTKIVNGRREVNVQTKDRKVHITDTNGKNIAMKVTETAGGKTTTKEYKAKDLAELKKTHPQAAKLYEKYTGNNAIRVRGGGFF